jgi:hypothetical protein
MQRWTKVEYEEQAFGMSKWKSDVVMTEIKKDVQQRFRNKSIKKAGSALKFTHLKRNEKG